MGIKALSLSPPADLPRQVLPVSGQLHAKVRPLDPEMPASPRLSLWSCRSAAQRSCCGLQPRQREPQGLRVTHPLAISFVRLAGSLLEAGSRLRVGREAGTGAREEGAFHTTGATL